MLIYTSVIGVIEYLFKRCRKSVLGPKSVIGVLKVYFKMCLLHPDVRC